jgi:hypothetical protein
LRRSRTNSSGDNIGDGLSLSDRFVTTVGEREVECRRRGCAIGDGNGNRSFGR